MAGESSSNHDFDTWLSGYQGVSVFPDFLHPNATDYWAGQFKEFFDPGEGIDIDGVW